MQIAKSGETKSREHYEDFDPYSDYVARFTCITECSRPGCHEQCTVTGSEYYEPMLHEDGYYTPNAYLTPTFINPPPPIVAIPKQCPKDIRDELTSAFRLYWLDTRSAANRIRTVVELYLTNIGIKRFTIANHRRRRLSLHDRIEAFRGKEQTLGDSLLAIKWIGNEGSHLGQLKKDDLLDAFELIAHVLDETYASTRTRLAKLARTINRTKKPRSKQSRGRKRL